MYKKVFRETSLNRLHLDAWVDSARNAFHNLFGCDPAVVLEEQYSSAGLSEEAMQHLYQIGFTNYSFDYELQNVWICIDPEEGKYSNYFLQAWDKELDERVHEVGIKFKNESDELLFRLQL